MQNTFWLGIVESRDDPMRLGRVQVRVFGVHTELLEDIPTKALPWAIVLQPSTSASLSGIGTSSVGFIEGSLVFGFFQDGESMQNPVVLGSAHGIPVAKSSFNVKSGGDESLEQSAVTEVDKTQKITATASATNTKTNLDTAGKPVDAQTTTETTAGTSDTRQALKDALGKRESSNNYKAINQLGYIGKYQMGAAMLTDLGYVKRGTTNKGLSDPANWTGKDGMTSRDAFIDSPSVQEKAMDAELDMNTRRLKKMGVVDSDTTDQELNGYLATSHLLGTGGARDMKRGVVKSDANGVTGNEYYKLGYATVSGSSPKISPENAVVDNPAREPSPTNTVGSVSTKSEVKKHSYGFADPNGVYPKYLREQDTNRLARNQNINKTIVSFKETTRERGVPVSHGQRAWDQPAIPFNARYPFNHVQESESGHVFEIDDTPKNERIHQFHTSGTFTEIDRNGTRVNKIVGDNFEILERNGYVRIKGSLNITIDGNANILVANDCNLEVDGNLDTRVSGDTTFASKGDIKFKAGGGISMSAASTIAMDGEDMHLNSGMSTAGSLKFPSMDASGLKTFPELTIEPRAFEELTKIETDDVSEAEVEAHREQLKNDGIIEEDTTPSTQSEPEKVETPPVEDAPVECGMFVPGNININAFVSPNFRLRDLTKGREIMSQEGLKDTEIACNLKALATNVLEAIKAKYPDMIITSGLRPMGDNPRSQHPKGMAADIQFTTKSSADYLAIAKDLASSMQFDQLILEYETGRRVNGAPVTWLHVSYSQKGNRREVFTMSNHKRISEYGQLRSVT